MELIADTHLHFYSCYDLRRAFENLAGNLSAIAPDAIQLGFLAERHDCHFRADLCSGSVALPSGITAKATADGAIEVSGAGAAGMFLLPGRQIVTAERIEIAALTVDASIEDGLQADEVVNRILAAGGIPVLNWAPGKWFFERGKVVERILDRYSAGQILVGDTSLRPTVWPLPSLMSRAASKGIGVVAGSDPLPFAGEEAVMGTYATLLDGQFDPSSPVSSARALLTGSAAKSLAGRRCGPFRVLTRLVKNATAKSDMR